MLNTNVNIVRNEVKQVAQQIEQLAKQVQTSLDAGLEVNFTANELARSVSTFVFTLGALYGIENTPTKTVKANVVSNPNNTSTRRYHNVRDALGRFVARV